MGILRSDRVSGLGGANAINGSVRFDKEGYLFVDSHSDWSLDGDFTIECWVKRDASGAFADKFTIGDSKESTGLELYLGSGGAALNVYSNNGGILVAAAGSYSANVWHHLALVRSGNTIKLYVDGTADNNTATNTATFSGDLHLGAEFYNNPATPDTRSSFYMSNFRIVKGTALYTANFTVPAQRLENISGTAILCCQSPGDVTQEATGKTIIPSSTNLNSSVPYATHIAPDVGEDHGTTLGDNTKFDTLSYMVPPGGTTAESNRGRALIMGGGSSPGSTNQSAIQYFNIQSLGTTQYFGALTVARRALQSVGSSTRGVALGGIIHPTVEDTIDYVTFATQSNATDFGNLTSSGYDGASASNNTRGIWAGGYRPNNSAVVNSIDYITIATAGNAADFGDLTAPQRANGGGSNTTRAVFAGGAYPAVVDTIEYVTIASTGNATDFGNLTDARDYAGTGSSPTRTCFEGGRDPSNTNIIDYITTASTGNATDFGDTIITGTRHVIMSNSSRGVIGSDGSITNALDYITFATTGNSLDFGDQVSSSAAPVVYSFGGCSDSHGGIS